MPAQWHRSLKLPSSFSSRSSISSERFIRAWKGFVLRGEPDGGAAIDQKSWSKATAFKMLIAEPDNEYAKNLEKIFLVEGFSVVIAQDGQEAIELFDTVQPGIVITEASLPKASGMDLCRHVRLNSSIPVVFLSSQSNETDIVLAFEIGANDYIAKPCRVREMVARVRAAHRRELERPVPEHAVPTGVFEYGDIRMDLTRNEVTVNGTPVSLTRKEFKVLSILLTNPGQAISREALITSAWGSNYYGDTKTLDVHVKRIRQKIEIGSEGKRRIHTIRGHGYQFKPDPDE